MAEKSPEEMEFDKAKNYGGDTRSRMRTLYKRLKEAAAEGDVDGCRRLRDEFRAEESKLSGIYARMRRAMTSFRLKYSESAATVQETAVTFPLDLECVGEGVVENVDGAKFRKVVDRSGVRWIRRNAEDAESGQKSQLDSECAADAIYAGFGIGAPMSRMYGDTKLTQDVGGVPLVDYLKGSASEEEKAEARKQFIDGMDVDCMLANWSCVGGNEDQKFAVIKDGKIFRTGDFAAMSFRVKGGKKGSDLWGKDPLDYFELVKRPNQQAVLGGMKIMAIDLMRRTLERNWDKALGIMSGSDRRIVEERLANVRKLVDYHDELVASGEMVNEDSIEEEMRRYISNGYRRPPKSFKVPVRAVKDETLEQMQERLKEKMPLTLVNAARNIDKDEAKMRKAVGDEVIDNVEKMIKSIFDKGHFVAMMNVVNRKGDRVVDSVFADHFKCQEETGTGNGMVNKYERKKFSERAFGTPGDTPDYGFEKYGFLANEDIADNFTEGTASSYGEVMVGFKKDKVITTWTAGDSLGMDNYPSLTSDPRVSSLRPRGRADYIRILADDSTIHKPSQLRRAFDASYIELQYHGWVDSDCIEFVAFRSESDLKRVSKNTFEICLKKGISVMLLMEGVGMMNVDVAAYVATGEVVEAK